MGRTCTMLALLAFALMSVSWARPDRSLAAVTSTTSSSSGTTTSSGSCTVASTSRAYALNELVCKSAYDSAFDSCFESFCRPYVTGEQYGPIPETVVASASATAYASVMAEATATSTISITSTISKGCVVPRSYSASYAYARSVSLVQVLARAFSEAYAGIYGYLGEGSTPTQTQVESVNEAFSYACSQAHTAISASLTCTLADASPGSLSAPYRLPGQTTPSYTVLRNNAFNCDYAYTDSSTAFADAHATAISNAVTSITNTVTSCGDDCARAFCDSYCVDHNCNP